MNMAKGKWQVISVILDGGRLYIPGRQLGASKPISLDNVEYCYAITYYANSAQATVDRLNRREEQKAR